MKRGQFCLLLPSGPTKSLLKITTPAMIIHGNLRGPTPQCHPHSQGNEALWWFINHHCPLIIPYNKGLFLWGFRWHWGGICKWTSWRFKTSWYLKGEHMELKTECNLHLNVKQAGFLQPGIWHIFQLWYLFTHCACSWHVHASMYLHKPAGSTSYTSTLTCKNYK